MDSVHPALACARRRRVVVGDFEPVQILASDALADQPGQRHTAESIRASAPTPALSFAASPRTTAIPLFSLSGNPSRLPRYFEAGSPFGPVIQTYQTGPVNDCLHGILPLNDSGRARGNM